MSGSHMSHSWRCPPAAFMSSGPGMILLVVSEVMLFLAFLWAFSQSSLLCYCVWISQGSNRSSLWQGRGTEGEKMRVVEHICSAAFTHQTTKTGKIIEEYMRVL